MRIILTLLLLLFTVFGFSRDSLFQKGLDEIMEDDYKKAQAEFLKDTKIYPSFSSYYNLGVASGKIKEWNKAKWAFESSLKYKPLNPDAQYNAKFATQQLSDQHIWTHPYPWLERVVLGFGITAWTIFGGVTAITLGLIVFYIVSKTNQKSVLKKWSIRLLIPILILFGLSFYGIYTINQHFNTDRYAIMKNPNVQFYISPNGVQIKEEIDPASRLEIIKSFKNGLWIQVKSQGNNLLWIKSENIITY